MADMAELSDRQGISGARFTKGNERLRVLVVGDLGGGLSGLYGFMLARSCPYQMNQGEG